MSQTEDRFGSMTADERLGAVMTFGDTGKLEYYNLLKSSIMSDPDIDVRLAALKRIHLFKEHPDLIPFLQSLDATGHHQNLEPYLSMALSRAGLITIEEFRRRINDG
jgi:hypothetical protein